MHIPHSLERASPGVFFPTAHRYPRASIRTGVRSLPRTPLGFVYPLCVHCAWVPQAFFHAWNAHGIPLTEPFAVPEADVLSDLFTPVPFILFPSSILLGRSLPAESQAVGPYSSDKAVPGTEAFSFRAEPHALLRFSPLRPLSHAMEPASRFLPFFGYPEASSRGRSSKIPI